MCVLLPPLSAKPSLNSYSTSPLISSHLLRRSSTTMRHKWDQERLATSSRKLFAMCSNNFKKRMSRRSSDSTRSSMRSNTLRIGDLSMLRVRGFFSFNRNLLMWRTVYFDDGTNPTMEMCREFIALCERVIKDEGASMFCGSLVLFVLKAHRCCCGALQGRSWPHWDFDWRLYDLQMGLYSE